MSLSTPGEMTMDNLAKESPTVASSPGLRSCTCIWMRRIGWSRAKALLKEVRTFKGTIGMPYLEQIASEVGQDPANGFAWGNFNLHTADRSALWLPPQEAQH